MARAAVDLVPQGTPRGRVVRSRHRQQVRPHALRDLLQAVHREVPVLLAGRLASGLGPCRRQPRRHRQARAVRRPVVAAEKHAAADTGGHDLHLRSDRRRRVLGAAHGGHPRGWRPRPARTVASTASSSAAAGSSRCAPATNVFPTENVVWTAPITLANELLGVENVTLDYLSTIFYNIEIDTPATLDFQWTYYGGDEIFSRVSAPTAFAPSDGAARTQRPVRRGHLPRGRRALASAGPAHRQGRRGPGANRHDRLGVAGHRRAHRARAVHLSDLQARITSPS